MGLQLTTTSASAREVLVNEAASARWSDFITAMKESGVDTDAWAAHISNMTRIRAEVVGRQITHRVENCIEPITLTGRGPPVYFIHSVLGTGTEVLDLADMLGPRYNIYSIRPGTIQYNGSFPSSIENIAKAYTEELRMIQSPGSLVLIGRSAGVVVALQMREFLLAYGYDVMLLVALDFAPYGTSADVGRFNVHHNYQKVRNWTHQLQTKFEHSPSYRSFIVNIASDFNKRIVIKKHRHWNKSIEQEIEMPAYFTDEEKAFVSKFDSATRKYRYNPSASSKHELRVLVYKSTKEPDQSLYNVEKKWRAITRKENLEIVSICGTHRSIAERPNVLLLANHLRNRLNELRSVNES